MVLILFLAGIFCFSAYQLAAYVTTSNQEAAAFEALSQVIRETTPSTLPPAPEESRPGEADQPTEKTMLAQYQPLFEQNNDFFGWIKIEGTKVDYPVMHTPEDEEYYLRRGFDKKYARSGVPFLSADCFEGCGNYLVHGHNMKNGSMFATLLKYVEQSYFEDHRIIQFDTLYETARYEIIAVFRTRALDVKEKGFRYYAYTDLTSEVFFEEYLQEITNLRLYDTGVTAEFGDTLLTLSTCSYHVSDGRLVVVAKKL